MKLCFDERQKLSLMGSAMIVLLFAGYGFSSIASRPVLTSKSTSLSDSIQPEERAKVNLVTPQEGNRRSARRFVSLNRATREDFERLPGVSPQLAQRIMEHRVTHGGFRSIEDVRFIPGVGPRRFEAMRSFLKLE